MSQSLALVFPGQGSQSVGMLSDVAESHPLVIKTFSEASDVLNYDLWDLVCHGPAEKLNQTEFTQPALMAADVAMWRIYCDGNSDRPALLAGHSLGEFVALVAAGAMEYTDAVKLVADRGRFMQAAVPEGTGAMAAIIGLDDDKVAAVCEQVANGEVVSPANYNSKGQVVIAGQTAAVERAIEQAKAEGAKIAKLIPVSVPSHCALMQPAADQLAQSLTHIKINKPEIPVIQNVDAKVHDDPAEIRDNLVKQLVSPVRWVDTIRYMESQAITQITECGPGKVLQGLIKRISRDFDLAGI
jgi:[acyl-carrier-protein] S-malonyltransferase